MQIQRLRRARLGDEPIPCDFCDQEAAPGFQFYGDQQVQGPRGGHLTVCDACLAKTKADKLGFLNHGWKEQDK